MARRLTAWSSSAQQRLRQYREKLELHGQVEFLLKSSRRFNAIEGNHPRYYTRATGWLRAAFGPSFGVALVVRGPADRALKGVKPRPCRRFPFSAEGAARWIIALIARAGGRICARDGVAEMAGDRLGRIVAALSAGGDAWSSARLCAVCPGIVGVNGAGVMLMSGDIPRGSLNSTDAVSPLRVGTVRLGALNLYRDRPGLLNDEQHADALVVADVAARWVLDAQAGAPSGAMAKELEAGADFHFAVHNAAGMVSVQEGISVAEALIRLRAFAFGNDRPLADVADDVVARRLRLG